MSTPPYLSLPPTARAGLLGTARGDFAAHDARPTGGARGGTVVLVPGFTGSKEDFIALLGPLAAAGYRVLAVDQRGQYETALAQRAAANAPEPADAYDLDALGADVLAQLAGAGDGPVHLVGHSFGGLAARSAVLREPAAVASLTLLCSGPGSISGREAERATMLIEALEQYSLAEIWTFITAIADAAGEQAGVDAQVRDFLTRRFVDGSATGMLATARTLLSAPDRTGELAACGVPLLVAHGEADYVWSPAEQATMAARLGARHVVIPAAGHSPAVEAPEATAAALIAFWAAAGQDRANSAERA